VSAHLGRIRVPTTPKPLPSMQIEFKPPTARFPSYKPMVIPPSDLESPVTTAVVAVATTSVTQTLFEPIKKKVQKQLQAKVNKWKEKRKQKKESLAN